MAVQLMKNNPQLARQFDEFMRTNQGKTPDQVLQERGIDPSIFG